MKRIVFIITLAIVSISMAAQQPQGGGGRGGNRGSRDGQRPPMRGQMENQRIDTTDEYWIMNFPEIPGLTQDNKRKIIDLLAKEKKEIDKLIREKMDLEDQMFNAVNPSEKEVSKLSKKIDKVESNIRKKGDSYDKKYKKILNNEQFILFKEKKRDIKFKKPRDSRQRPMDPNKEGRQGDMPEGNMPPPPSDMFMFGGGPE